MGLEGVLGIRHGFLEQAANRDGFRHGAATLGSSTASKAAEMEAHLLSVM